MEDRIIEDIAAHFTVLKLVEAVWTKGEVFARNLTRMYGDALPAGSDKELHCGSDPLLAVVVRDERPRYRLRRTNRGPKLLNSNVFDARSRYRQWTGGGHRVHGSDSVAEANRNLVLLLGRRSADFEHPDPEHADRPARERVGDPVGTHGWESVDQLLLALEAHGCSLLSWSSDGGCDSLTMSTPDAWWAEHIAGGEALDDHTRVVPVGDGSLRLVLVGTAPRPTWNWVDTVRPWVNAARRLRDSVLPTR